MSRRSGARKIRNAEGGNLSELFWWIVGVAGALLGALMIFVYFETRAYKKKIKRDREG